MLGEGMYLLLAFHAIQPRPLVSGLNFSYFHPCLKGLNSIQPYMRRTGCELWNTKPRNMNLNLVRKL